MYGPGTHYRLMSGDYRKSVGRYPAPWQPADMNPWNEATASNRAAWNEIAELRSLDIDRSGLDAQYFANGGVSLPEVVIEAVPQVEGLRLLHLQCASGEESLSWAVLGARVTAVDISDVLVDIGKRKATQAGLNVDFVRADVGALPRDLRSGKYDITYTGGGVLVWVPDIDNWAQIIASTLRPGGTFVLYDGHPITVCMERKDSGIAVVGDYFGRAEQPESSSGWRHFPGGEGASSTKVQFSWPLGDVVTALVHAGLTIEKLAEYPSHERWRFGEHLSEAGRLPGMFLLVARRP